MDLLTDCVTVMKAVVPGMELSQSGHHGAAVLPHVEVET